MVVLGTRLINLLLCTDLIYILANLVALPTEKVTLVYVILKLVHLLR